MKTDDLRRKYGKNITNYNKLIDGDLWTDDYVLWLEKQLLQNKNDSVKIEDSLMINRVEVIDENGRSYVNWDPNNRIKIQVQDNGRTLKVFVSQCNQPLN